MKALTRYKLALKHIPRNASRILDIGGSDGEFVAQLLECTTASCDVVEPFPSQKLLSLSRDNSRCRLFQQKLEANTLTREDYDFVTILDVFEHVDDEALVAREIVRLLRPGGRLIFSVPHVCWYDALDPANTLGRLNKHFELHRHYSIDQVRSFFPDLRLDQVYYQGTLFGVLIKYLLHYRILRWLPASFGRLKRHLERQDYARSWGRQSYHMLAVFTLPLE